MSVPVQLHWRRPLKNRTIPRKALYPCLPCQREVDWRQDTNCCFIAFYLRYPAFLIYQTFLPSRRRDCSPSAPSIRFFALSLEKHYRPCLLMNALRVSQNVANRQHPCLLMNALFVLRPAKLWAFNFGHPARPRKRVRFCCSAKPSQLWWGLFSHSTIITLLPTDIKKGEVLLLGQAEPTMVGDCNCLEVCFKNSPFLQPITAVFRTAVLCLCTEYTKSRR